MTYIAKDFGIIDTTTKELPILAVNVLDRLGYSVSRASKQLDQVLASKRLDEKIGLDWWHSEYKIILRWTESSSGVLVDVEVQEHKGGATQAECQQRCDEIILRLQEDAARAKQIAKKKDKPSTHGSASWGDDAALRAAGYITNKPEATRLIIGRTQNNEYISVPELATHAHAIVCGRTGVGKSRGFFIPNLIERLGTNMIVTEATPGYEAGELYSLTSGWRDMAGHQIYSFNPADMSSTRINPVDRVRLAPLHKKAEAAESLADLVIMNGEREQSKGENQTWDRSEKQLLIPLIMHAAAGDPEYGHMGAIRWLLLAGIDKVRKALSRSPSPVAQMEFEGWLQGTSDNFRFGVISGLMTKLNPWMTDQLVALTSATDIDFEILKQRLFTFYLAVPSRSRDSKLIGSLMVNFLLNLLQDIQPEMKYPTSLFLDEFTNFGRIANAADILSIVRKSKLGLVLGFQNYFQLERIYSRNEAQVIFDQPATQIYFRQKHFREARALSDALGRTTVEEISVSDTGRVQEFIQGRALASPEELINLKNEVIVFTNDTWPLKLNLTSATAYEHAMAYPPPARPVHEISDLIRCRGRLKEKEQTTNSKTGNSSEMDNNGRSSEQAELKTEKLDPDSSGSGQSQKDQPNSGKGDRNRERSRQHRNRKGQTERQDRTRSSPGQSDMPYGASGGRQQNPPYERPDIDDIWRR